MPYLMDVEECPEKPLYFSLLELLVPAVGVGFTCTVSHVRSAELDNQGTTTKDVTRTAQGVAVAMLHSQ